VQASLDQIPIPVTRPAAYIDRIAAASKSAAPSGALTARRPTTRETSMPARAQSERQVRIVGLSGNWTRPSRTRTLVQTVLDAAAARGLGQIALLDLVDAGPALLQTMDRAKAAPEVERILRTILTADALVVGSAVHKGAYAGLFKHLFDLFDKDALSGKPVVVTASGNAPAHASVIDYHLRPLFLALDATVATRGVYALADDYETPERVTPALRARVERSVDELARLLRGSLSDAVR
jgi:FMN reductase